jgi:hypothetical protein
MQVGVVVCGARSPRVRSISGRIWIHILYRIVTMFHVMHQGLGPKLELTHNPVWGEHCRKEALAHAALVNQHLGDGRAWLLDKDEPTFADITLCVAIAFSNDGALLIWLDPRRSCAASHCWANVSWHVTSPLRSQNRRGELCGSVPPRATRNIPHTTSTPASGRCRFCFKSSCQPLFPGIL